MVILFARSLTKKFTMKTFAVAALALACIIGLVSANFGSYGGYGYGPAAFGSSSGTGQGGILAAVFVLFFFLLLLGNNTSSTPSVSVVNAAG